MAAPDSGGWHSNTREVPAQLPHLPPDSPTSTEYLQMSSPGVPGPISRRRPQYQTPPRRTGPGQSRLVRILVYQSHVRNAHMKDSVYTINT